MRRWFRPWFFQYLGNDLMWGRVWSYVCPCVFSWQWNTATDIDRSWGNVQLQVVASCCHQAHLSQGKASWEAEGGRSEGRHFFHRWWSHQGSCQAGCWPCLAPVVLWNSSPSQSVPREQYHRQRYKQTELGRDFPTWIHYSSVSLSLHLLATALCWLQRIYVEINLAARGIILAR